MVFVPKTWENAPSTNTPITAQELNRMEAGIVEGARAGSETVTGNVELATVAEMMTGTDLARVPSVKRVYDYVSDAIAGVTVGQVPAASETVAGIVELATAAEMSTGADLTRAPSVKRVADYVTTALAGFSGGGTVTPPVSFISGAISMIPLTLKAFAGQTADLFRVTGSDNAILASVDSNGQVTAGASSITGAGMFKALCRNATTPGMRLTGAPSQSGHMLIIQDSATVNKMFVAADGTVNGKNVGNIPGTTITFSPTLVLDAAEAVPAGVPAGTVILRRPA